MLNPVLRQQKGFSLIELLVVIVVIGILATLILFNVSGVDQRKAMQTREIFLLDLRTINKIALDQSRIIALNVNQATDIAPISYNFMQYDDQSRNRVIDESKKWQTDQELPERALPHQVSFTIEPVDQDYATATRTDLIQKQAPKLIWLGNGEVKPVRVQFYLAQQPIGNVIEIDHLGHVNEN